MVSLYVLVADEDGNQDWNVAEVVVYEATDDTTGEACPMPWEGVCP